MQEVDFPGPYQPKKLMYQIDIQTGEAAELFSFNANDWLFGAYEDNLIICPMIRQKKICILPLLCYKRGDRRIFRYSATDDEKAPVTALNGNILYLVQPIGNTKAEVSCINLKNNQKLVLCSLMKAVLLLIFTVWQIPHIF